MRGSSLVVNVTTVVFALSALFSGTAWTPQPGTCTPDRVARADTTLAEVYENGRTWDAFLADVDRRRELWIDTWRTAVVPEHLADRARGAGGWRVLIITAPGCSDSANSVPYIARLVQQTPGLDLRLVDATVGRPWREAHRSPDGRAATPTVLVLDEQFNIRGCWVEQPAALQEIWLPIVRRGTGAAELDRKMDWYAADAGRETLREIVEVLESARDGQPSCPGPAPI